ncbi:hypothetical protein D3C71_1941370 [compost metagenome]
MWFDHGGDVLFARCVEQHRFCHDVHWLIMVGQQQLTDLLRDIRTARLTRDDVLDTFFLEVFFDHVTLSCLASPVNSFQGNHDSTLHLVSPQFYVFASYNHHL